MKLTERLAELQAKVADLASQAALVPGLNELVASLTSDKEALTVSVSEKETLLASLSSEKEALTAERDTLAQQVAALEGEKKETEEQALEIVAGLGLKAPVAVDVEKTERPSAEGIRAKYLELQSTSPSEAARFFNENRSAILNGFLSE